MFGFEFFDFCGVQGFTILIFQGFEVFIFIFGLRL